MTFTDKHIVETYSQLLEGLSASHKVELIENLTQSLKKELKSKDEIFYSSFGAFASEKAADEIVSNIKANRKFRTKEIKF